MSCNTESQDTDAAASLGKRKVGKWPGVVGFTYNGACYCVECAIDSEIVTEEHFDCNQEDMPDNTGVLFGTYQHEWDVTPTCDVCHDPIPEQTVLNYE